MRERNLQANMETWLCRKSYYKTTDIYLSRLLEFCKRSLIWPESNRKIKNLTENNCIIAFNYSRTTLVCFRHHNPDPDFSQVPINSDSFNEIPDCEVYYVSISLQTKNGTHISIPFREEYPGKCQFHDITSGSIWLLLSCVIFTSETRSKKKMLPYIGRWSSALIFRTCQSSQALLRFVGDQVFANRQPLSHGRKIESFLNNVSISFAIVTDGLHYPILPVQTFSVRLRHVTTTKSNQSLCYKNNKNFPW